jgi:hypothetical protein
VAAVTALAVAAALALPAARHLLHFGLPGAGAMAEALLAVALAVAAAAVASRLHRPAP